MYCIDTNIFLDWWQRRYPPDVFPCIQAAIESLVESGRCFCPERVKDELRHVGPNDLKVWAKARPGLFIVHDTAIQEEANRILHQYPDFMDPFARHDEADRYIVALSKLKGLTVVTHETRARTKRNPQRALYIPDVCDAETVPCIELLELMRREKWSFK